MFVPKKGCHTDFSLVARNFLIFRMTSWSLEWTEENYLSWELAKNSTKPSEQEWDTGEKGQLFKFLKSMVNYSKPFLHLSSDRSRARQVDSSWETIMFPKSGHSFFYRIKLCWEKKYHRFLKFNIVSFKKRQISVFCSSHLRRMRGAESSWMSTISCPWVPSRGRWMVIRGVRARHKFFTILNKDNWGNAGVTLKDKRQGPFIVWLLPCQEGDWPFFGRHWWKEGEWYLLGHNSFRSNIVTQMLKLNGSAWAIFHILQDVQTLWRNRRIAFLTTSAAFAAIFLTLTNGLNIGIPKSNLSLVHFFHGRMFTLMLALLLSGVPLRFHKRSSPFSAKGGEGVPW